VKQSKNGEIRLTLNVQDGQIPVYNSGGIVDGTLHIAKTESVSRVEVKIEGRLQVKEIAEGGTVDRKVCITSAQLWSEEMGVSCPNSCRFQLTLPTKFDLEGQPYVNHSFSTRLVTGLSSDDYTFQTLPPTYSVKLSTVPGFTAFMEYTLSAVISKSNLRAPLGSLVKASFLGIGNTTLSTPFIYVPRTRPAAALPAPLQLSRVGGGFDSRPEWQIYESTINSRRSSLQNIKARLYIPASRIFCVSQNIPFHLTLESSALSLATFLPFGPTGSSTKKCTRLQIMRQVTVDARNKMILGTKTDMWRVDCLGEATAFKDAGGGATWMSFTGELSVNPSMKVMGFKVGGITVKVASIYTELRLLD
jgi:hypothetical protein